MNILLISYGDLDYDGRLRSLISVFESVGKVYTFTRGSKSDNKRRGICNVSYPLFIKKSIDFSWILHSENQASSLCNTGLQRIISDE